eukprot:1096062_1
MMICLHTIECWTIHVLLHMLLITSTTAQKYGGWSSCSPSFAMSRSAHQAAIGYSSTHDSIWIIGGSTAKVDLIQFIEGSSSSELSSVLQNDVYGGAQFWTQIDEYVYIIDPRYASSFMRFHVDSRAQQWNYQNITIPVYEDYGSGYWYGLFTCLTSINVAGTDYLVVVGGSTRGMNGEYVAINDTQILSLSTFVWESNVPTMNIPRRLAACVTVNDTIYAIAGRGENGCCVEDLDTVETLTISDMSSKPGSWTTVPDTLTATMKGHRALVYGTDILVFYSLNGHQIDVIDSITNTISPDGYVDVAGRNSAPIVVSNRIYLFTKTSNRIDCRYKDAHPLFTIDPTDAPSRFPSSMPSASPSDPSSMPSVHPSSTPSANPSSMHSVNPSSMSSQTSVNPSTHPSIHPSSQPSASPSSSPIMIDALTTTGADDGASNLDSGLVFGISLGGTCFGIALIVLFIRWMYDHYECTKISSIADEGELKAGIEKDRDQVEANDAIPRQIGPGAGGENDVEMVSPNVKDGWEEINHEPQHEGVRPCVTGTNATASSDVQCVKCGDASKEKMIEIDGAFVCMNCIKSNMNLTSHGETTKGDGATIIYNETAVGDV